MPVGVIFADRFADIREDAMKLIKTMLASTILAGLVSSTQPALAHCDSVDGPVAKVSIEALDTGNVYPVLAFAPATAESEITQMFESARKVRMLGPDAKALADRSFLETVIRLHREGEGATYTGLKAAGIDYGPVIRAAEDAIRTNDVAKVKSVLGDELDHALAERFAHVRETRAAESNPNSASDVPKARERISAELGFITYAETIRQAILGKGSEHHAE
jgi:hypothetical protein